MCKTLAKELVDWRVCLYLSSQHCWSCHSPCCGSCHFPECLQSVHDEDDACDQLTFQAVAAAASICRHLWDFSSERAEARSVFDTTFSLSWWIPLVRCSGPALNLELSWRETLTAKAAIPFLVPWPSGSSGSPEKPSTYSCSAHFLYFDKSLNSSSVSSPSPREWRNTVCVALLSCFHLRWVLLRGFHVEGASVKQEFLPPEWNSDNDPWDQARSRPVCPGTARM